MQVLQRTGVPRHCLRSQELDVDPGAVTSFNDKSREHSDAGAVEKIQFPQVEDDGRGRIDQCFLEHVENRGVVFRSAQP